MYTLLREPFLGTSGLLYAVSIDVFIIFFVIVNIIRGSRIGLLRQLMGLIGFIVGMFLGVLIIPYLVGTTQDRLMRTVITLVVVGVMGIVMGNVAEMIAKDIRLLDWQPTIRKADNIVGAIVSAVIALFLLWIISAFFVNSSLAPMTTGIQRSFILRAVSAVFPDAPSFVNHVGVIINPGGTPQVFKGLEPWPVAPLDATTAANVETASAVAEESTVQVDAIGCSGIFNGSGFVVGSNIVATNAHVVAGIKHPVVVDKHGAHITTPIFFDPRSDVALLRASNLAGRVLRLSSENQVKATGVTILGYPNGGPFKALPGVILDQGDILGHDIYSLGDVTRNIYTIRADIQPGSSGSPIILNDGSVGGMVYGRSLLADNIGYAMTSTELSSVISGITEKSPAVDPGTCTGD